MVSLSSLSILKIQATSLGFALLLFCPLLALLAFVSSLPLTDWSHQDVPPRYAPEAYFPVLFGLMLGGFAAFCTFNTASWDSNIIPHCSLNMALRVSLPTTLTSMTCVLLLCIALPNALGSDVHFNHLDIIGFIVAAAVSLVFQEILLRQLAPMLQPQFYNRVLVLSTTASEATINVTDESNGASSLVGLLTFALSLLAVIIAYPTAIIPLYCSDTFNDYGRLIYCLLIHPVLLEHVLFKIRNNATAQYDDQLRRAGMPIESIKEDLLFNCELHTSFIVEAIFVFNRRFMLRQVRIPFDKCVCTLANKRKTTQLKNLCPRDMNSMMRNPVVTTLAIVLTAIEEGVSRATMVDRDTYFRRLAGKPDYAPKELAKQHIIWTVQTGNSMLIEVVAILTHAAAVQFFLPHRFIFNFGYGSTEAESNAVAIVMMSMTLELVGELITDHIAIHAESAHGVPVGRYFELLSKPAFAGVQLSSLVCAMGIVLWTFSRIPSAAFCDTSDPCSCLDHSESSSGGGSNFEIYRAVCTTCVTNSTNHTACANVTALARDRFTIDPDDSVDAEFLLQLGFALSAVLGTSMLVYGTVNRVHRRRALRQVQADQVVMEAQLAEVEEAQQKIADLEQQLRAAKAVVNKVMNDGGTLLAAYELPHQSLSFGPHRVSLGEGSFGTVYKATLRGQHSVAVKTIRVSKIDERVLEKFKGELLASAAPFNDSFFLYEKTIMAPLQYANLVRLYGGVWNEGADKLCIVLEFCQHGSLVTFLAQEMGTWEGLRHGLALGAARGLKYLHHDLKEPLIHRDVKPDNVLVGDGIVAKLADFGETTNFDRKAARRNSDNNDDSLSMTMVGTKLYCAPEVMDTFSFALVLLSLAAGDMNYVRKTLRVISADTYASGQRPPIPPQLLTPECSDLVTLIEEMWATDFRARPSFVDIVPRLAACASLNTSAALVCEDRSRAQEQLEGDRPVLNPFSVGVADQSAIPDNIACVSNSLTFAEVDRLRMTHAEEISLLKAENDRLRRTVSKENALLKAENDRLRTLNERLSKNHPV